MTQHKIYITGTAGFVGFHLARYLLDAGHQVHGFDGMTDYYDVSLKQDRTSILSKSKNFSVTNGMLEDDNLLSSDIKKFSPDVVVHLAAQAGVRYSLENPRAYLNSNLIGTFNILELAKELKVKHLLMASTSSVYGGNTDMPFKENDKADTPLTFYAATKKANESMAHSYSHLWDLPVTMFRFFTVYGEWGRPDLALYKFARAILTDQKIDVYNHGQMYRDFTYVGDLVHAISLLIESPPVKDKPFAPLGVDSLSPIAPFRVVNIGNNDRVLLKDFISAIELSLDKKAVKNMLPMQMGDVPATWADTELLQQITGYTPSTSYVDGVAKFVAWFREYYQM